MRQKEFAWLESMGVKGIKVDFFSQDSISTMNYFVDILEDPDSFVSYFCKYWRKALPGRGC